MELFDAEREIKRNLANFESYSRVWCGGVVIYFDGRLMIYGKEFLCFDFEF